MLQYSIINIKSDIKQNGLTQQVIETINREEEKGHEFVQVVPLTNQENKQILIISRSKNKKH